MSRCAHCFRGSSSFMGPRQSSRFSAVLELVSFSSFSKTVFAHQLFPASLGSLSSLSGCDRYHPNHEMGLHHGTRPCYAQVLSLAWGLHVTVGCSTGRQSSLGAGSFASPETGPRHCSDFQLCPCGSKAGVLLVPLLGALGLALLFFFFF